MTTCGGCPGKRSVPELQKWYGAARIPLFGFLYFRRHTIGFPCPHVSNEEALIKKVATRSGLSSTHIDLHRWVIQRFDRLQQPGNDRNRLSCFHLTLCCDHCNRFYRKQYITQTETLMTNFTLQHCGDGCSSFCHSGVSVLREQRCPGHYFFFISRSGKTGFCNSGLDIRAPVQASRINPRFWIGAPFWRIHWLFCRNYLAPSTRLMCFSDHRHFFPIKHLRSLCHSWQPGLGRNRWRAFFQKRIGNLGPFVRVADHLCAVCHRTPG